MQIEGCLEMYATAVKLALDDFRYVHKDYEKLEEVRKQEVALNKRKHSSRMVRINTLLYNYETAKNFLFHKNGLEYIIEQSALPLNIKYLRRKALTEEGNGRYDKMKGLLG